MTDPRHIHDSSISQRQLQHEPSHRGHDHTV